MRLVDLADEAVGHGFIVRFPGDFPGSSYEAVVDYLLVLRDDDSFEFVVATGYKAGLPAAELPAACIHPGTHMLSIRWLIDNWGTHVRPEVPVDRVECLANYPAPAAARF
jgi:hypothetical protein